MKYITQHRRGTTAQWADKNTIIPLSGELVIEIDEESLMHKLKIGDGIHTYAELAYLQAGDEVITQVLSKALPRVVTVTLDVDKWSEVVCKTDPNLGYFGQAATLDNITEHSRLDLQPDADMLAELKQLGVVFVTENKGGTITIYSVGNMPLKSYTMQATIVETEIEEGGDKIVGIPVGMSDLSTKMDRFGSVTSSDDGTSVSLGKNTGFYAQSPITFQADGLHLAAGQFGHGVDDSPDGFIDMTYDGVAIGSGDSDEAMIELSREGGVCILSGTAGVRINNLVDPNHDGDAVNKRYVDSVVHNWAEFEYVNDEYYFRSNDSFPVHISAPGGLDLTANGEGGGNGVYIGADNYVTISASDSDGSNIEMSSSTIEMWANDSVHIHSSDEGNVTIRDLAAPVFDTDAVNKKYVDDLIAQLEARLKALEG